MRTIYMCEIFVYKHAETIEYAKKYPNFLKYKLYSRILGIQNAKFSGYCFYMNTNI